MLTTRFRSALLIAAATVGLAAAITAVLLGLILTVARHNKRRAEKCFADFLALEIGRSTFNDIMKLHSEYGGTLINGAECGPEHCEYQFTFQNAWLHRLHLAPRVTLVLGVGVDSDRLTGRSLWYGMDLGNTPATHVMEVYTLVTDTVPEQGPPAWERAHLRGPDDFKVDMHMDSKGHPFHYVVWMNTNAPANYRQRAYSVDLQCLAQLGECDPGKILAPFVVGVQ